jgi:alpha-galactosidase
MDFDHFNFDLITLDGAWIRERHSHRRALNYGKIEISSRKGISSPDHNPFLILCDEKTTESSGGAYGFALVYSGNHNCSAEVNTHDNTRVQMGINHFDFSWNLAKNSSFQAPEAVLAYSDKGLSGLSTIFHNFIRHNIVRGLWQFKERPVLINNWEATYFDFNEKKLLKLARDAKDLGIELFVLDDGWFGKRNDDKSSLGDWYVNLKKLPRGLKGLADKIKKMGLDFGIWVEPEMISIDSDLYRKHPEWMVQSPYRDPSPGRYQFLLDLTNSNVCAYIYQSMKDLFNSADISYVKWDMNRNFSDLFSSALPMNQQKEFSHRYVLGLYSILEKLTSDFPHILFESCASGGGRFDLAMFKYMPQIWTSDDTDAVERLQIQWGSSLFAPLSVLGAHVSAVPNHQVIRNTPIESRFNTAAFGLLGYELDVSKLTNFEKKVIKKQISFYRIKDPVGKGLCLWVVVSENKEKAILGYYQVLANPNPSTERYQIPGLNEDILYHIQNREQFMDIRQFGDLINMILPVEIKTDGFIHSKMANNYMYKLEKTEFNAYGDQLMARGFVPKQQFYGTGLDEHNAYIGDFGSRLFILKSIIS